MTPLLFALALLQAAPAPVTLRAGTPVRLTTVSEISSRGLVQGRRVPLRVAQDVAVGGEVLVPAGTAAVGEIEAVSEKGMFGKAAKFTLRPLFVELGGRRVNLTGRRQQAGEKGTTAAAVTTFLAGGLGLIITGKSATLAAGSEVLAEVRDDMAVR